MPFTTGTKLGTYEIVALLGAGGMGEVYQATDTKLGRSVAIKILPSAFAHDVERVARSDREARVLASLNHPRIAAIYGLEESGDRKFLVMELAAGETLAERIARGPIPVGECLEIAEQIAEALEEAHEKGIIHRDLKPANIKITADGRVKVLDFGLAKAFEVETVNSNLSNSPTLSVAATNAGMILGTAAYMSPEQAKGMMVDRRTDIFAFGAVLYEMLTSRQVFSGETVGDVLAAVIRADPDWSRLPAETPLGIRRLLRRCLEKDRSHRLHTAADARIRIEEAQTEAEPTPMALMPALSRTSERIAWIVAAALLISMAALALVHFREGPPVQESLRFQIPPPGTSTVQYLTLSPDGRYLAFVAGNSGSNQVWVRAMDTLESRALGGTDGATFPFWSPDGAYLGFFSQGKLKKIAIAGGPAQTLCDAANGRGGAWNRDGVIIFSPGPTSPLFRVPAAGGVPAPVTKLTEGDSAAGHRFPVFLPDGIHILYNAGSDNPESWGLFLGSLDGSAAVRLFAGDTRSLYAPASGRDESGHLLFRREGTLMAQPFDPEQRILTGDAFPLAEDVPESGGASGFGAFSVSDTGVLVFLSGDTGFNRELVWIDRTGKRLTAVGKPNAFTQLALSPDEKTVALRTGGLSHTEIWILNMGRDVLSRFTFRPGFNTGPTWSPDGNRVAFAFQALGVGPYDIFQKPAGGNGVEERLLQGGINVRPDDWSPDGRWILFEQTDQKTGIDIWLLPLDGDRKPIPYLQTVFSEQRAKFSPDGKWITYQSNESGKNEVYVQAVPASGAKFQISSSGGNQPQWRRDGKELFYVSADLQLMATTMNLGSTVEPGTPHSLFPLFAANPDNANNVAVYAPSRDGQRFLVIAPSAGEGAAVPVTVVTQWQTGLKK